MPIKKQLIQDGALNCNPLYKQTDLHPHKNNSIDTVVFIKVHNTS